MFYAGDKRRRVALKCPEKGLTEQSHKKDCDLHVIMRKAMTTGIVEHVSRYKGTYGDFSNAVDMREAETILAEAQQMFESVPAQIRKRFDNDPGAYVDFMTNPENRDAIIEMGLDASHLPEASIEESKPPEPSPAPAEPSADGGGV